MKLGILFPVAIFYHRRRLSRLVFVGGYAAPGGA